MTGWLSVNRGMGMKLCLKSLLRRINHIPSMEANEPAMSSDSIEDLVTSPCFFDAHETGELLNLNTHPDVDLLSLESPAMSASVKPVRRCGCLSAPLLSQWKVMPWSQVCNRYCNILFAASQCICDGLEVNWVHLLVAYDTSGHMAIAQ